MKILLIQVGDPIEDITGIEEKHLLKRICLNTGQEAWYWKQHIINADSQMQSLKAAGLQVDYGYFKNRKSPSSIWQSGKRIRQLTSNKKYDLVHVLWGTTSALMTVFFSRVPVVISFSGSDLIGSVDSSGNYTRSGKTSKFLSQVAAVFAKKLITKSENMKQRLWTPLQKKTFVIPNGIDLKGFQPLDQKECQKKLNWSPDKKYIIFFDGSGATVKNQALAEKVFELVKTKIPNSEFVIVKGIPHAELVYVYNAADIMLLTSFHEGSNNSTKEAMACNLPIVSVDCGDAKERLEHVKNSYVIPTYQADLLADKAIDILSENLRSDARKCVDDFSMETIAKKLINLYKTI